MLEIIWAAICITLAVVGGGAVLLFIYQLIAFCHDHRG